MGMTLRKRYSEWLSRRNSKAESVTFIVAIENKKDFNNEYTGSKSTKKSTLENGLKREERLIEVFREITIPSLSASKKMEDDNVSMVNFTYQEKIADVLRKRVVEIFGILSKRELVVINDTQESVFVYKRLKKDRPYLEDISYGNSPTRSNLICILFNSLTTTRSISLLQLAWLMEQQENGKINFLFTDGKINLFCIKVEPFDNNDYYINIIMGISWKNGIWCVDAWSAPQYMESLGFPFGNNYRKSSGYSWTSSFELWCGRNPNIDERDMAAYCYVLGEKREERRLEEIRNSYPANGWDGP